MCDKYFEDPGKTISKDISKIESNPLPALLGVGAGLLAPEVGGFIDSGILGATGSEIGSTASDALAGSALGGGAAALTGGNPITGALTGGVTGGITGSGALDSAGDYVSNLFGGNSPTTDSTGTLESGGGASYGSSGTSGGTLGATSSAPATAVGGGGAGGGYSTQTPTSYESNIGQQVGTASSTDIGAGGGTTNLGTSGTGDNLSDTASGGPSGLGPVQSGGTSLSASSALSNPTGASAALNNSSNILSGDPLLSGGGSASSALPSTGTAAASSSGGLLENNLGNNAVTRSIDNISAKQALGLGGIAYELAQPKPSLPSGYNALQPTGAATAPLLSTESTQLGAYNSGSLTPAQQASLDQYQNQLTNQVYQQFAQMGITDPNSDSRFAGALQNIQNQVLAQKATMMQQELSAGTQAGQAASANLNNVGSAQTSQQNTQDQSQANMIKAFAELFG